MKHKFNGFTRNQRPALLLAAATLAACTSGLAKRDEPVLNYENYAGAPVDGFILNNLDGWEDVAPNKLLVWNGASEAYLLTVWKTCNNLRFASVVNVSSTARQVSRVEMVTVDGMSCPITDIRPVDVKAMYADRAKEKKSAAGEGG